MIILDTIIIPIFLPILIFVTWYFIPEQIINLIDWTQYDPNK